MKKPIDPKSTILLLFFLGLSVCLNGQDNQTASVFDTLLPDVTPIPVVFLGSYHMSNPGADAFNLEADDVTVPKRQKEIKEVVRLLSRFKPKKK